MRSTALVLVVLGGCGRVAFDPLAEPSRADAGCAGEFFDPALAVAMPAAIDIVADDTFDTDLGLLGSSGPLGVIDTCHGVRVVTSETITIGSGVSVVVSGSLPLALVATQRLEIHGAIDVHAARGDCAAGVGGDDLGGGGGGGGGGYAAAGGRGGLGDADDGNPPAGPGAGGTAGMPRPLPNKLAGGCAGGAGGKGNQAGGVGGPGGGALLLFAPAIEIGGIVRANGEGGGGGPVGAGGDGGGGGGGSGGLVVVLTDVFTFAGTIVANGGAGAEGSGDTVIGEVGQDGTDGDTPAIGGGDTDTNSNNDGGRGGHASQPPGADAPGMSPGGGGGGGGSVGYILIRAGMRAGGGTMSPSPVEI